MKAKFSDNTFHTRLDVCGKSEFLDPVFKEFLEKKDVQPADVIRPRPDWMFTLDEYEQEALVCRAGNQAYYYEWEQREWGFEACLQVKARKYVWSTGYSRILTTFLTVEGRFDTILLPLAKFKYPNLVWYCEIEQC